MDKQPFRMLRTLTDDPLEVGDQRASTVHALLARERVRDLQSRLTALAMALDARGEVDEALAVTMHVEDLHHLRERLNELVGRLRR